MSLGFINPSWIHQSEPIFTPFFLLIYPQPFQSQLGTPKEARPPRSHEPTYVSLSLSLKQKPCVIRAISPLMPLPQGYGHNPHSLAYVEPLLPLCGIEEDGSYVWILASDFNQHVTVDQVEAVDWVYQ